MTVATVILLVVLGIFVLFGIINGAKNGFGKQSINLIFDAISVVVSAFAAMPITKLLCNLLYDKIIPNINFEELGLSSEFIGEYGVTLASMLVSPLVFGIVFILIALICKIPAKIICRIAWGPADEREEPSGASRFAGVILGVITAGAVFVSILAPLSGYANSVATILNPPEQTENTIFNVSDKLVADSSEDDVKDILNGFKEINPVLNVVNKAGGQLIFNQVTTAKIGDTNVSLGKEVQIVGDIVAIIPQDEEFNLDSILKDDKLIEAIGEKLSKSKLLTSIGSDLINEAHNTFSNGKDFLGIKAPDQNTTEGQLILNVLDNFKDCTPETMGEQVKTVTKTIATIQKHGIIDKISNAENNDAVMEVLSDPEVVADLIDCIFENEVMSNTILDFAASFANESFKDNNVPAISEKDEEKILNTVNNILDNISSKATDAEKINYCKNELKTAFNVDAGAELDENILDVMSTFVSTYSKLENTEKANQYINKLISTIIEASR